MIKVHFFYDKATLAYPVAKVSKYLASWDKISEVTMRSFPRRLLQAQLGIHTDVGPSTRETERARRVHTLQQKPVPGSTKSLASRLFNVLHPKPGARQEPERDVVGKLEAEILSRGTCSVVVVSAFDENSLKLRDWGPATSSGCFGRVQWATHDNGHSANADLSVRFIPPLVTDKVFRNLKKDAEKLPTNACRLPIGWAVAV